MLMSLYFLPRSTFLRTIRLVCRAISLQPGFLSQVIAIETFHVMLNQKSIWIDYWMKEPREMS